MTTEASVDLVVFAVEGQRHALPVPSVERVLWAVEVTRLPGAPDIVLGAINVRGRIVPVINTRRRFGVCERPIREGDHFIVARSLLRTLALAVDAVEGMVSVSQSQIVASKDIVPGLDDLEGILKLDDGMILVQDLDRLLSLDEEKALSKSLPAKGTRS